MIQKIKVEIEKYLSKNNVYYKNFSQELVDYLNDLYPGLIIQAQWYMIKNNINHLPQCKYPLCNNVVKWNVRKHIFDLGCCSEHNKRITSLKNFGTEHPNQSKKQKLKLKRIIKAMYGVDNIAHIPGVQDKIKHTNMERYGSEYAAQSKVVRDKIKETNLKKYGVTEILNHLETRDKIKETNLKKYGSPSCLSNIKVRNKINSTNLIRYGSIFPMKNSNIQDKRKSSIIEHYGDYGILGNDDVKKALKKTKLNQFYNKLVNNRWIQPLFPVEDYINGIYDRWLCNKCGCEFRSKVYWNHFPSCPKCNVITVESSTKPIEINNSILFELNHNLSEQYGCTKYKQFNTMLDYENSEIRVFQFFNHEFNQKQEIINHFIGINDVIHISIDNSIIKPITNFEINEFVELYSLSPHNVFIKKSIGCYHDGLLVAVFGFSTLKNKASVVMKYFIEKPGFKISNVVLNKIVSDYCGDYDIYYFADRRYNSYIDKEFFESINFNFAGVTEPLEHYYYNGTIIPYTTIYNALAQYIPEEIFNEPLNIKEKLELCGYLSIWDSGKLVYKRSK